jgi:methionyl-tRNA formyltransferase
MRITVFTSNQPRHNALIARLATIADTVYAVQECNTIFPGEVQDFFKKSETMQRYFSHVIAAERKIFGQVTFPPENVRSLPVKSGDLSRLGRDSLGAAMDADVFLVFGASYIKGWLIDELVARRAINIHMGISPYYRGSSCNFWALYDDRPDYVGATIHMLSKGLDSGEMLYHCAPRILPGDSPFDFTMRAVEIAHASVAHRIATGALFEIAPVAQDKTQELRYTRNADFTDAIAAEFLARNMSIQGRSLSYPDLLAPYFGD